MTTPNAFDIETISNELLRFASVDSMIERLNIDTSRYNEVSQIMSDFKIAWDNAPCDEEGATKSQDQFMDQLLDFAAKELESLV